MQGEMTGDRAGDEALVLEQLRGLLEGEPDTVARLANVSALLMRAMDRVSWIGFYVWDGKRRELVLGPFQGPPACTRIAWGRGVCGTAARDGRTVRVEDVRLFPGHIACDAASRSEIVVPIRCGDRLFGVLDADSTEVGRFNAADEAFLEKVAAVLGEALGSDLPATRP